MNIGEVKMVTEQVYLQVTRVRNYWRNDAVARVMTY